MQIFKFTSLELIGGAKPTLNLLNAMTQEYASLPALNLLEERSQL